MATNTFIDLKEVLGGYSKEIDDLSYEIAKDVAREGVKEIKEASPTNKKDTQHKGRYKRGWRMDIEKGFGTVQATIHNAIDYQLTHLLEKEHVIRNQYGTWGTYSPTKSGTKHIQPVEEKCIKTFERDVEQIIKES